MIASEITPVIIASFLRLDEYEEKELRRIYDAAIAYAISYTGLSAEKLDEHEDISTAILVLCQDMYDNRSLYLDKSNVNKTVDTILNMHCVNLL